MKIDLSTNEPHTHKTKNKNKSNETNNADNVLFQFMDDCAEDIESKPVDGFSWFLFFHFLFQC